MTRLVLRLLVRLHPPSFRRVHGRELRRDLFALLEGDAGRGPVWPLAVALVLNTSWRLIAEWATVGAETMRDLGRGGWDMRPDMLRQDVRFALRSLLRDPGFALAAAVTIGLGIGVTTTVFGAINGVLLQPLPYPEADALQVVSRTEGPGGEMNPFMSEPDLRDLQSSARSFDALVGYGSTGMTLTGLGDPVRISGARVTDPVLEVLGLDPALGRDLTSEEALLGGPDVVVIGHGFWQTRLGGDPDVLGRTLELNGSPWEIIGVAPPGFDFPGEAEFWVPWHLDLEGCGRGCHTMQVIGRLADGIDAAAAGEELSLISARLQAAHPESNHEKAFHTKGLQETMVGDVQAGLWILLAAVASVLLIACANVANLLLVRSTKRCVEFAVRGSLGAGPGRLLRQVLTESVVLAAVGGVLGLGVAWLGVQGLRAVAPDDLPRVDAIAIDASVLVFAAGLVLLVSALSGLVPAVRASRSSGVETVGRAGAGVAGRSRYRSALLMTQTALSLVLLLGAGLLARSFASTYFEDLGYETEGILTFNISLPAALYPPDDRVRFFARLEDELSSIPGVARAGSIFGRPLGGNEISAGTKFLDRAPVPEGQNPVLLQRVVTKGYFQTMGIRIVRGRGFTESDRLDQPKVVIVSQRLVDVYYPDADPLGRQLDLGFSWGYPEDEPRTIIGVVADHRSQHLTIAPSPQVFIPQSQFGAGMMSLVVRTDSSVTTVLPAIRDRIAALDPQLPLIATRTMREVVSSQLVTERFFMLLLVVFAGFSLLLAAVGLFGVVTYAVSRRAREIGVRIALGAAASDVAALVRRQALAPAVGGLVLGLLGGLGAARLLESMLYEVGSNDPVTAAGATLFLFAVVLASTTLPARRAARVAPATTLREQ